ncbi:restriction endonuclease subunit S [Citrobacter braakii]|uniref:restriction endonuclease subunit S n=1 Tax=Citrobacter braakii TaxID=57706 RepID=UPI002DB866DA|nr:restriction endonuclease subunit S [Citrobacter braakii]MEB8159545.1 restriction endonuclease subunit S [Citrobacter braakii]
MMAEFNRVDCTSLDVSRLDAEYYGNVYVKNAELIEKSGTSLTLEEMRERSTPIRRGIDMPQFVENESSPKMVTIASFDEPGIQFDQLKRVSLEQHNAFKGSHIQPDDLLVAMGGYAGKAAICPQDTENCNIGRHTARIKIDPTIADARYIWAFITCRIGTLQFERYVTGSVQAGINLEDIRDIKISVPCPEAQKYIGNKIRQAEKLRAWAKRLENRVQSFHSQFIPDQMNLDFGKKTRKVSTDRMTERLDAHFYPGVVEQYLNTHPCKFESLSALTTVIYNGQTQPESFEEFCEQITVANLSASFIKGQPRKVSLTSKVDKFIKIHDILMCNAAHNKSYIGRELTYVHTDKKLLPSTEVMTIRVNRDLLPASYVRTYLLSRLGYVKVQSTIRGITAHSYPDDVALLDIYIPEVESNQKQQWFKQDELLVQAGCAVEFSQKLTSCAKTLVEALIEGQLTEQQLIQAQQALEDGDNSFDQAILSKLSAEGYAIEGATPLFSDVDELYSLLEEAAQAEAEE